jgi:ParB/RepB/Spo0J family partition protein
MNNDILKTLPLSDIVIEGENLRAVRPADSDFLEIRESISSKGVLMPIVVSPRTDVDGNPYYLLVDGAHRYTACQHLGIEEIPVSIRETSGTVEVLEIQIAANAQKADTKPAEYAQGLKTLMAADPLMTKADLANMVNKSVQWVDKMLSLTKIKNEEIVQKIDGGEVSVMNAYQLAKLDSEDQVEFLAQAITEPAKDFQDIVNARIKANKEAAKAGKSKGERTFPGKAVRRKDSEITAVSEDSALVGSIVADAGASTLEEAFILGLQYTLSLDPQTLAARRQEWEDAERMRAEKTEKAKLLKKAARVEQRKLEVEEAAQAAADAALALSDDELAEAKKLAADNLAKKKAKAAAKAEAEVSEDEGEEG